MTQGAPEVSVVVAVYNGAAYIKDCLEALCAQDMPPEKFEIIAVDDGSTDATPEICQALPRVRYIRQENAGPSTARNAGVAAARAPIVAFTDADCIPDPGWLPALCDALGDPAIAAAGGPHTGPEDDPPHAREIDTFLQRIGFATGYMQGGAEPRDTMHIPSCNAAYRRTIFDEVGGFRAGLYPGEDVDLDRRICKRGHRLQFVPRAHVRHHRPATPAQWRRMLLSYGESSAANLRLHGPFRLIHAFPPALLMALVSILALLPWPWLALANAATQAALFLTLAAWIGRPPLGFTRAATQIAQTGFYFSLGYWRRIIR